MSDLAFICSKFSPNMAKLPNTKTAASTHFLSQWWNYTDTTADRRLVSERQDYQRHFSHMHWTLNTWQNAFENANFDIVEWFSTCQFPSTQFVWCQLVQYLKSAVNCWVHSLLTTGHCVQCTIHPLSCVGKGVKLWLKPPFWFYIVESEHVSYLRWQQQNKN